MKKVLLGTTAMVSVGLVAAQASAAEPIELSFGGYHNWAVFYADNDDNPAMDMLPAEPGFNRGNHDIKFDGELQFQGKTVLDNGLEVGVRIELEGEHESDQLDENYAYIEGSFGTFRIGNDDAAAAQMATAAPYLNYVFAANSATVFGNGLSQFFSATGRTLLGAGYATFSTFPAQTGDDRSVMYFSPVFNGFQFGMSYAQDDGEARPSLVYQLPTTTMMTGESMKVVSPVATHDAVYSVAGRYDGEIGDFGLTVAAGYLRVKSKDISDDMNTMQEAAFNVDSDQWDAGIVVYYGNWGLGGSYTDISDMRNVAGTDIEAYDIGLAYWSDGAFSAGIYWLHEEIDYSGATIAASGFAVTGPNGGGSFSDEFDAYRLMGQYDLGPGIAVTGAVGFDQFDDGAANKTYDTTMVGAGLLLSF
jgi:outer membrane protein OmpU